VQGLANAAGFLYNESDIFLWEVNMEPVNLTLDGSILLFIQEHLRHPALDGAMTFITTLGNTGAVWIALSLVLLIIPRTRRWGLRCALALLIGFLITNVALKNIIQRIRPYEAISALNILVPPEHDFSFPSGHATSSLAAAWALFRTAPRKYGVPALVLAVLIALSRLYVGVHYPTDVLAGVAIGILAAECAVKLVRFLAGRRIRE